MNKLKYILSSLVVCLGATSCVDMLDDNVNPDRAHQVSMQTGLPVVVFYAQQTTYDHADYYIYLSQCLTTTGKSSIGGYSYKSEWEFLTMNRHPQWRRHFYDIGVNVRNLIDQAEAAGSHNYTLIARTIRLLSTQLNVDMFGDMPLTEAYKSNSPKYDNEGTVYAWLLQECDDLIAAFEDTNLTQAGSNQTIDVQQDRVYAGDLSKWKGLVYAIKARVLLRNIPNIDTSSATCQKIIDAADKAIAQWRSGDLLYGAWFGNEPRYNFDGGTNEQNNVWSAAQPIINSWESRKNLLDGAVPSKYFLVDCLGLNGYGKSSEGVFSAEFGTSNEGLGNDPRIPLLMIARKGPDGDAAVRMRCLENNIGAGTSMKTDYYPSLYMGAYAGSSRGAGYNPIFTMEELYFIKAEAEYWMGNKTAACQLAKEATEHNIERHLTFFQSEYGFDYPGNCEGGKPLALQGFSIGTTEHPAEEVWNAQVAAFLNNEEYSVLNRRGKQEVHIRPVTERGNEHWFFNENEYTLHDLMTQKYIAMYMQPEQFTDMRRYHFSNKRNNYGIGDQNEIIYGTLRRPYNLYAAYWIDGLTDAEKENLWVQRIPADPETEMKYNRSELERLGAYANYKWIQKPLQWAQPRGTVSSLTEGSTLGQ